jgi:hypothetical protein
MVLVALLQVVTTLVDNCTYERLSSEHIPNLYNAIIPHWKNKGQGLNVCYCYYHCHSSDIYIYIYIYIYI